MSQLSDPRVLANKNQAMLTVLRDGVDDLAPGDLTALRADANGNLLSADPRLQFDMFGRLMVDTEAGAVAITQYALNGEILSGGPELEFIPSSGPAPVHNSTFQAWIDLANDDPVNDLTVTLAMAHYVKSDIGGGTKTVPVSSVDYTVKPLGTTNVPFNTFDFVYDPSANGGACPAPMLIVVTAAPAAGQKLSVSGVMSIVNGQSFTP